MSINTRKEDALSIVGDDDEAKSLVDAISKEAALVGKSELVIKSDLDANTDEIVVEESMHNKEDEKMMDKENEEEDMAEEKKPKKEQKKSEVIDFTPVISEIRSLRSVIEGTQKPVEVHPLDELLGTLRAEYDKVIALSATAEEKLRSLQEPFNTFSQTLIEKVRSSVPVEKTEISEKSDISVEAITESVTQAVMGKVGAQLAEITAMLKSQPATKVDPATVTREDVNELIHRRSFVPTPSQNPQQQPPKKDALGVVKYKSINEIVEETTR